MANNNNIIYDHDKNHVKKLILFSWNKFCSFDNEDNANIFKILYKNEIVSQLKKYDIQEMKFNVRLNTKIL